MTLASQIQAVDLACAGGLTELSGAAGGQDPARQSGLPMMKRKGKFAVFRAFRVSTHVCSAREILYYLTMHGVHHPILSCSPCELGTMAETGIVMHGNGSSTG
jgi:hypothetical protein